MMSLADLSLKAITQWTSLPSPPFPGSTFAGGSKKTQSSEMFRETQVLQKGRSRRKWKLYVVV